MTVHEEIRKMENHYRACACKSNTPFFSQRLDENNLSEHNSDDSDGMIRTRYQHDRDKILYSHAFRRLRLKTQIFPENIADHLRTRLDHTLEVSQLARHLSRQFKLNEDLVDAIALGHDIGHTPFAHSGERALNRYLIKRKINGFKHNWQGLRIGDFLEKAYPDKPGLNLTNAVRFGILKHTDFTYRGNSCQICDCDMINTLNEDYRYDSKALDIFEIQIVKLADDIAGVIHDIEDSYISKTYTYDDLFNKKLDSALIFKVIESLKKKGLEIPEIKSRNKEYMSLLLSRFRSELIYVLTHDIVSSSKDKLERWEQEIIKGDEINFNEFIESKQEFPLIIDFVEHKDSFKELKSIVINDVISSERVKRMDGKADRIINLLLEEYRKSPNQVPDTVLENYRRLVNLEANDHIRKWDEKKLKKLCTDDNYIRTIVDYVAGMTDRFALKEYDILFSAYPRTSL